MSVYGKVVAHGANTAASSAKKVPPPRLLPLPSIDAISRILKLILRIFSFAGLIRAVTPLPSPCPRPFAPPFSASHPIELLLKIFKSFCLRSLPASVFPYPQQVLFLRDPPFSSPCSLPSTFPPSLFSSLWPTNHSNFNTSPFSFDLIFSGHFLLALEGSI